MKKIASEEKEHGETTELERVRERERENGEE